MMLLQSDFNEVILGALINDEYFETECENYTIHRDDGSERYVGLCKAKFDESVNLFFTLPSITRTIYVTVSDGEATTVRRVLATIEDHEREHGIQLGNVLLIDDAVLKERRICAVIFLPPSVFNVLDQVPLDLNAGSNEYRILGIVFMTEDENEIRKNQGHDALMDFWTNTDKDLISLGESSS